jgi:hypothetical protein
MGKIDRLFATPAFEAVMMWVILQPPSCLFQVLCGIWLAHHIRYTIRYIYVSRFHQFVLALFMSLVGDQVLFFFPLADHSEPPFLTNLQSYFRFTFIEWGACILTLLALSFVRERLANRITSYATPLFLCFRALWSSRMFHHFPGHFLELDDHLALIIALFVSQWADIVDFIARKLTDKRAALWWGRGPVYPIIATVCYMTARQSRISNILGFYPFDYACTLLFINQIVLTSASFFFLSCHNQLGPAVWN